MKTFEELNLDEGLSRPSTFVFPDQCMFCRSARSGDSHSAPNNYHPDDFGLRKCDFHSCWVPDNAFCADYSFSARAVQS